MNQIRKFINWFFYAPNEPRGFLQIVAWWEIRRIPYNLLVGSVGFASLILFYNFAEATHKIPEGEDFVEPFAILLAPFAMNFCYTSGEIYELIFGSNWIYADDVEPWSTALLKFGTGFSLLIVLFPSIFWGIYLLLLKVGLAK